MKFKTFTPYGKRALIKLDSTQEMTEGGIIIPTSAQRPSQTATIIDAGSECEKAKKGKHILIPQDSATEIMVNDQQLFLIHEDLIDGELE